MFYCIVHSVATSFFYKLLEIVTSGEWRVTEKHHPSHVTRHLYSGFPLFGCGHDALRYVERFLFDTEKHGFLTTYLSDKY